MVHFVSQTVSDVWRAICSAAKPVFLTLILFLGLQMPSFAAPFAASISKDWLGGIPEEGKLAYAISRKGKRLGFQTIDFETLDNGDLQVDVHIEIDFALIIPLFTYTHQNREVWRDGQLLSLNARTDNNGDDEKVSLKLDGDKFIGEGTKFVDDLEAGLMSTSYFNPNFIRQEAVISSQDGRRLKIGVEEIGRETLTLQTGRVEATRFRLTGKLRIDIWYTDDGQWVKTTFTRGGNTLVIEQVNPVSVPPRSKWRNP